MIKKKTVSQCITSDYCKGWNDAVDSIVKCKDCKWGGYHEGKYYCRVLGGHSADWFCAYGERKTNNA